MKTNETKTTSNSLRDTCIGIVLVVAGLKLFAVAAPLGIAAVCVGAVAVWNGVTAK